MFVLTSCKDSEIENHKDTKTPIEVIEAPMENIIPIEKEVLHIYDEYFIDLDIDPALRVLSAKETIKYTNKSNTPFEYIYINIPSIAFMEDYDYPPYLEEDIEKIFNDKANLVSSKSLNSFEGSDDFIVTDFAVFNIYNVFVDNEKANFGIDNTTMEVKLSDILKPGDTIDIAFDFEAYVPKMNHRFGGNDNVMWLSNFLPTVCVFDEIGWHKESYFPLGGPVFSDTSHFLLNVKTPSNYSVFGPNVESAIETDEGIITIVKENLIRNFALTIYNNDTLNIHTLETGTNVQITFYSFSDIDEEKEKSLAQLKSVLLDAIEYYNFVVGAYPYNQLHVFEIDYFENSGFSSSQSIFLDSKSLFTNFNKKEITNLIGKQWFGQIIGHDPIREPWLGEGLVNFMSNNILYNDAKIHTKMLDERTMLNEYMPNTPYSSLSDDMSIYTSKEEYDNIQVIRSNLAFYALRQKLGYSKFMSFIKEYYKSYAFTNVNSNKIINIAEQAYEEDLKEFFYIWMEAYTLPMFD